VITALVVADLIWILPLPIGVAGHEGSTVVVGLNGLRLLRAAAWRSCPGPQSPKSRGLTAPAPLAVVDWNTSDVGPYP